MSESIDSTASYLAIHFNHRIGPVPVERTISEAFVSLCGKAEVDTLEEGSLSERPPHDPKMVGPYFSKIFDIFTDAERQMTLACELLEAHAGW